MQCRQERSRSDGAKPTAGRGCTGKHACRSSADCMLWPAGRRRQQRAGVLGRSLANPRVVVRKCAQHMPDRALPRLALHPAVVGKGPWHVLHSKRGMWSSTDQVRCLRPRRSAGRGEHAAKPASKRLPQRGRHSGHVPALSGVRTTSCRPAARRRHSSGAAAAAAARGPPTAASTPGAAGQAARPAADQGSAEQRGTHCNTEVHWLRPLACGAPWHPATACAVARGVGKLI